MEVLLAEELRRIAKGEILSDSWSRDIYSVDASHYTIKPSVIVCPKDEYDIQKICQHGFSKNVSITARGAGTGLLGQSLSNNIVIDFTKYMNKIIEIGADYIIVQPGLVKGVVDKELKKKGKFLPPDPASSNYCTIGGMIANNSSGAHCLGYGSTIDFLQEINVVYSDGSVGFVYSNNNTSKFQDDKIANLLRLLSPYVSLIQQRYPKVSKNSCGYRLDAIIDDQNFHPQKIFAASEGTLGIITSAKLKILDIPLYRCLLILGFEDLLSAMSVIPLILQFSPVALEMLDNTVIHQERGDAEGGGSTPQHLASNGGCLLFVEFAEDRLIRVDKKLTDCKDRLSSKCAILESVTDEQSMTLIWGARKGALNRIMKLTFGTRKPIGLIEDTVVTPNLLYDHIRYLLQMYNDNKLDYVMYGHAGNGNLHTRPLIDINSQTETKLIEGLAHKVFKRVIRAGGTITGEHGDGLARTKYVESLYGQEIFSLFRKVKKLFDPKFIMNPGKKVVQ
jgi:FAD/FMN-containing dehydrogenase